MLPGACAIFNQIFGLQNCHNDPQSPESRLVGCPIQTCPNRAAAANPINYVNRRDPPLLIVHGQQDLLVPWQQSVLLYRAVQRACGDAKLVLIPRGEHGQWNEFFTDPAVNAGATLRRTHDCHSSRARTVRLSWNYVIHFFNRNLRRHQH
jgi:dienelactone hydrolase